MARDDTAGAEFDQMPALLEHSLEDLYEHAPCGYVSTLPSGTIIKVNETFLTWTGYQREHVVGRLRLQDLFAAGDRILYETHLAPLLRMQGEVQAAVDVRRVGGPTLPTLISSQVKRDEAGEPVLIRATFFNASDRRAYERELLHARHAAEASEARARALAQTLQESFIPPTPPTIDGLDIGVSYRPAGEGDEVGGDFYDVFETGPDDWVVVLGDVCGKGVEAAKVTALARYTVRTAAMQSREPAAVLSTLNQALLYQHIDRFLTIVYARARRIDGQWTLTTASGGHPIPLRIPRAGPAETIARPGTLLGVRDTVDLHEMTVPLESGDVVFFHSDGVTEARRGDDFFGEARMQKLLLTYRSDNAMQMATGVVEEVVDYQEGVPRDDIAVVVLKVPAAEP
jgi:phosphoserine phosphatase RsbU/P